MTRKLRRAEWLRLVAALAILLFRFAGPAYSASDSITFTPATLTFTYQAGAALPASQSLQVKSSGAALSFTVSITGPLPYSGQWLTVSTFAGTSPATLKVYVNPTGLPSGSYTASIVVTSSGAGNSPQNFPVTLEVGDAPPTLSAAPSALTFNWVTGQAAPAAQSITVASSGAALSASITVTSSNGSWLSASPSGNIALVGLPSVVSVSVNPGNLLPGTYSGKITFSSTTAANSSVTVSITLNVSAGVPTAAAVWPAGIGVNSPQTVVTLSGTNFLGTSTAAVNGTVVTNTVLSSTATLVTIPASALTTAGNLSITVTTPPPGGGTSAAATFVVYPPGPQILAIANSASYDTNGITPGGIITIYGTGLGPTALTVFQPVNGDIPTSLPSSGAATSVSIDGNPAPLLYTSGTQLSCIVPFEVATKVGQQVNLTVTYNAVTSAVSQVNVLATDPGVFTLDASGVGQGAILNYNATTGNYTINGSANAAATGSIVVIYLTGFGQTNPVGQEDVINTAMAQPVGNVSVTIGGQAATVQAADTPIGSVPGVLQLNVTVPASVTAGNSVPVVVTVGNASSQSGVTMAVK